MMLLFAIFRRTKPILHHTRWINLGFTVLINLENDERTLPIE